MHLSLVDEDKDESYPDTVFIYIQLSDTQRYTCTNLDTQTDRQTDRQAGRQTVLLAISVVHSVGMDNERNIQDNLH